MKTDNYNFGADKSLYSVLNEAERSDIFFYARPVTERRGFDLGLMALELFHKQMPNCTIHFAGWDVSEWGVPFPYVNHAAMQVDELNDVYNKCSTALVMSLTNMSLLPLELLSAGVIPVVNDGPNNRLVSDNENIAYIDASPQAMADALVAAVKKNNKSQVAKKITGSVPDNGWDESGKKVISIIEKELRRAK
jgi:glycosyltransferase involved in cell wall biosynthesis